LHLALTEPASLMLLVNQQPHSSPQRTSRALIHDTKYDAPPPMQVPSSPTVCASCRPGTANSSDQFLMSSQHVRLIDYLRSILNHTWLYMQRTSTSKTRQTDFSDSISQPPLMCYVGIMSLHKVSLLSPKHQSRQCSIQPKVLHG
jgi:hypothetical protein